MFQCNRLLLFISLMAQTLCCQGQEDRNYWIERYLSVSYPLQHIKVTSPYGNRKDPFTGKKAFHSGIDLKARNEEVLSMFDGYVEQIGEDSRSGRYVVLRHGDYQVSYCHLSKVTAYEGEELLAGDAVGITGSTGRSTGEHLHITLRYKGERQNPYILLTRIQKVRKECADALRRDGLTDSSQIAFIETYAPAAIEQQRKYGIPASVTLAQMALESRWGTSNRWLWKAVGEPANSPCLTITISASRPVSDGYLTANHTTPMMMTGRMRSSACSPMLWKVWNTILPY